MSTAAVLRLTLWTILLAAVSYTTADPDLWGHVRFGLDILRDGSVTAADSYSFTSDRLWINHEWLAEVLTGAAFAAYGNAGLIALKVTAIGIAVALLNLTLRHEHVGASFIRDALGAGAVILTMEQTHHVRPQLFSVGLFAVQLWCLTEAERGSRRWLLLLPPVFACWANLHGGWLLGGGVLLLWAIGLTLSGARREAGWCAAVGVAALAATLVTPYGIDLWRFLASTVGLGRPDIVEWQPVYLLGWDAWLRWSVTLLLCIAGIGLTPRGEIHIERIGVVVALAVTSFMVVRLQAFFGLAVLFLLGGAIGRAYQQHRLTAATSPDRWPARRLRAFGVAGITAALLVTAVNATQLRVDPRLTPDAGAVAFLRAQPANARVLVWFDWGEYALWHLAPRMRVSIDGRRETVYSDALRERHLRFYYGVPGSAHLPEELAADYVWLPRQLPAAQRLEADAAWRPIFRDARSIVFGRAGRQLAASTVSAAPAAATRVFPGP